MIEITPSFLAQQPPAAASALNFLLPVIIVVIFYFLVILPQRKRQKKVEEMIRNLRQGDRVIISGGIYGTVDRIKDTTLMIKVADQVKLEVAKNAVAGLQSPEEASRNPNAISGS